MDINPQQIPGMARLMPLTPELIAHYSDTPQEPAMTQPTATPVRTLQQAAKGRALVIENGQQIGSVRYESAHWWAYDLQGNPVSGGYGIASQAAAQLPSA